MFAGPRYQGPRSGHFDGRVFHNQVRFRLGTAWDFLRWRLTRRAGPDWDSAPPVVRRPPPPRRVGGGALRATFVNHSTVLLQHDGMNVLTDPIWSERCSPLSWVGPRRVHAPGVPFDELPPIDVVLISHNHYDHLDLPTLRRLHRRDRPLVLVPLGNRALLERAGIDRVVERDWWASFALGGLELTAVPAQHHSNRGLTDRAATLWCGWAARGPSGLVYFAGDTGWGPQFAQLRRRLGRPRLALLPIGAFCPRWFLHHVHLDPEEAVAAHRLLGADTSMAIHFGTFELTDEGRLEPPRRVATACRTANVPAERFWVLEPGEARHAPRGARARTGEDAAVVAELGF